MSQQQAFVERVQANGAVTSAIQLAVDGHIENEPPKEEDVLRCAPIVREALTTWPEAR